MKSFLLLLILPAGCLVWIFGAELGNVAGVWSAPRTPLASTRVLPNPPRTEKLSQASHLSADYLARQILEDGKFVYRINLNEQTRIRLRYNILRHAGGIYALGSFYEVWPSEEVALTISLASDFLRSQIEPLPGHPKVLAIWSTPELNGLSSTPKQAKLGGTGLGLVALLTEEKIHPSSTDPATLRGLGEFLLAMQKPDGNFYSKYVPSQGGFDSWISLYYPGEAALALVMLYEMDGDPKWLEGASSTLRYLSRVRHGQKEVPHDHWALLATARLWQHIDQEKQPKLIKLLLGHTVQICVSILLAQDPMLDDQVRSGSFYQDGRTTPCATRMEGLQAALSYLPPAQTSLRARIETACDFGIQFLLRAQIKQGYAAGGIPRSILGHPEYSHRVRGKRDPRWSEIRIDYVQHALSALLQYRERKLQKAKAN